MKVYSDDSLVTMDVKQNLNRCIESFKLLDRKEEKELIERAQSGDREAYDEFVNRNLRLVRKVATCYAYISGAEFDDLFSEGCMGLMRAINKFDAEKGVKFSTYAFYWIFQKMKRFQETNTGAVRYPNRFAEQLQTLRKLIRNQTMELKRELTTDEMYEIIATYFPSCRYQNELMAVCNGTIDFFSLDSSVSNDEDLTFHECVADPKQEELDDIVIKTENSEELKRFIYKHTAKERDADIIFKRFGFDSDHCWSLTEIGEFYDISWERVRQICNKVLLKIGQDNEFISNFSEFDC